ncbi:MAG TPA: LPS export ABC transporter permease LptF [Steroidobacteraceae bacterium]|nr:LPS export ABC transporter permease LptF [Steroidobacteraceae bacterium]
MGRLLERYILREMIASGFAVTLVLVLILLTNEGARVLSRAADSQYPHDVVFTLIGLGAVQHLPIFVAVGLLLGMVMAFGRLYHDSEMTAALACGVGMARIYAPVIAIGIVVAAVLAWLSLEVGPASMARVLILRQQAVHAGQFASLAPGRFRTFGGGSTVVYAQDALPDGTLSDVFVERDQGGRIEVALAQRARHMLAKDGQTLTIILYDGERFEGLPGSAQFRIIKKFSQLTIPVQLPRMRDAAADLDAAPTRDLIGAAALDRQAQLQWRIALPVMCLVLAVLAVPISRLPPRRGRLSRVWLAVLVFILYFYLLSAGRAAIEHGTLPAAIGLWWTHGVVVITVLLIARAPNWLARMRNRSAAGPQALSPA